jgi:hypothetical protein
MWTTWSVLYYCSTYVDNMIHIILLQIVCEPHNIILLQNVRVHYGLNGHVKAIIDRSIMAFFKKNEECQKKLKIS